MQAITVEDLKSKIESKEEFLLLDVREDYEYEEFNLDGKLIPLGILPMNLEEIEDYKSKEVVVMCRSGNRSAVAQQLLQNSGFAQVYNLTGGTLDWIDKFGNQ